MWVSRKRFAGTLGGGEFERRVLEDARRLLQSPQAKPHLKEYVLCREMGQCCGGRVEVFFETVPRRKTVHLLGGGHVGRAAALVFSGMPLEIHLVDSRPQWSAPEGLPSDIRTHGIDPLEYARARAWDANDAVCIFTHSHALDFLLVKYFLQQPVGYLGLIGSEHKAQIFEARLKANPSDESLAELWEEKMHCPIGLPLASKNPKVIAVSIAAQLLQTWGIHKD